MKNYAVIVETLKADWAIIEYVEESEDWGETPDIVIVREDIFKENCKLFKNMKSVVFKSGIRVKVARCRADGPAPDDEIVFYAVVDTPDEVAEITKQYVIQECGE